jgi:hypothetical protein
MISNGNAAAAAAAAAAARYDNSITAIRRVRDVHVV